MGKECPTTKRLWGLFVRSGTEAAAETTLFNVYCWGDYRAVHAVGSSGQRVYGGPDCPGHLADPHRPLRPHHGTPLLGMAARTTESRGRRDGSVFGALR